MASLFQAGRWGRGFLVWVLASGLAPVVPVAFAQELLPELAAPAAQHKAADEALDKQKLEAIAAAAKSYVSALDSVEKAATAKGEIDLVAAVVKEREAVAAGALEPSLPEALPKAKLQMSRKTLLASIERINADFAKRKKKADADYLRVLATLQAKAAANPELGKQIAAEKAALLGSGVAVAVGGIANGAGAAKVSRGKNVVVNGDFGKVVDDKPEGWAISGSLSRIEKEGNNSFVRIEGKAINPDGTSENCTLNQVITIPKEAKTLTVSARIQTKGCVIPLKEIPRVVVGFKDKEGKSLSGWANAYWDKNNGPWRWIEGSKAVPPEAVTATVYAGNSGCPGQVDFDDVVVTFK